MMYEDITTDAELKAFENSEKFYLVVHYDPSIWAPELESRLEWDIREKKKSSIKFKDGDYKFNGMDDYEEHYLFNNKHEATIFMYEKKIEEAEAEIEDLKRNINYYKQRIKTAEEQLKASQSEA
jgi:hypothetical protein